MNVRTLSHLAGVAALSGIAIGGILSGGSASAQSWTIPCAQIEPSGVVLPFPHGALGDAREESCTIKQLIPFYRMEWRATAPDGRHADFIVSYPGTP